MNYLEEERFLILIFLIFPIASVILGYIIYGFFKRNKNTKKGVKYEK